MNKKLEHFLIWIWCFPQMVIGLIYYIALKNKITKIKIYKGIPIYCFKGKMIFGLSLGKWIFIEERIFNIQTIKHEYGHKIQNYIFGPLAIIFLDIPSTIIFFLSKINKKIKENYHKYFPERWADKLGEVKRA
ncbi:MAG: hypothetical protein U9Q73_01620 [Nanoarchaeota archaeon]|nr:hypothetical protein [Nanoarchaeota archaeon]